MTANKERWGTWDDAEELSLELSLSATPAARLEWLERSIDFAYRTGALGTTTQLIAESNETLCWPDSDDDLEVVRTTTPAQRLEWLEEMLDLALASGALAKARELERREALERFHGGASSSTPRAGEWESGDEERGTPSTRPPRE